MNTRRIACLGVAALISVAAISGSRVRLASAQPTDAPKETVIALERGGCFGTCPIHTVRVDGRGEVTYEGRCFVGARGARRSKADPAAVEELVRQAKKLGYFDMQDRYEVFADPPCPGANTDMPTVVTSITHDGRTKSVHHNHGCEGPTLEALSDFENRIDSTAGTAKWLQHSAGGKGRAVDYYLRERKRCWPTTSGPGASR